MTRSVAMMDRALFSAMTSRRKNSRSSRRITRAVRACRMKSLIDSYIVVCFLRLHAALGVVCGLVQDFPALDGEYFYSDDYASLLLCAICDSGLSADCDSMPRSFVSLSSDSELAHV